MIQQLFGDRSYWTFDPVLTSLRRSGPRVVCGAIIAGEDHWENGHALARIALAAGHKRAVEIETRMCIAVIDSGANLKALVRMDDAVAPTDRVRPVGQAHGQQGVAAQGEKVIVHLDPRDAVAFRAACGA